MTEPAVDSRLPPAVSKIRDQWQRALLEGSPLLEAADIQFQENESILQWAVRVGMTAEVQRRSVVSCLGIRTAADLRSLRPTAQFLERFPISFARQHLALAFDEPGADIALAIASVDGWSLVDVVGRVLRRRVRPIIAPESTILTAINAAYEQRSASTEAVLGSLSDKDERAFNAVDKLDDLLASDSQTPVVELVNLLLLDAVKGGASDIHFQPYRDKLAVRYRIDGVLFDAHHLPKSVQDEAISRLKIMGKMNIAEKRLPQDGRATVTVGERLIDLRIASLPGSYGERVVLRLLDKSARLYTLDEIGMNEGAKQRFRGLIEQEHGLILLTGPTGSGKTTTLYGALREINTRDRNVLTLEDPIEYDMEGISQTQINVKKGLTFASGLRNVLRQDPDIIMVGEVRDNETAVMAIQAALTGHLVFSTLHTNDAASAVARLLDLGIEPYLVSSSLLAVIAQRLVRKICGHCAEDATLDERDAAALGLDSSSQTTVRRGRGCAACRQTGYSGRVAICEVLTVDEPIRQKIQNRASAAEIRDSACARGMQLLRDDGVAKILAGVTTPSEVTRVTVRSSL